MKGADGEGAAPIPRSELEEAEQLAEALRRSLRLDAAPTPEGGAAEPEPAPAPAEEPAEDHRYYAVWAIPGRPQARGLWHGPHPRCWEAILRECPRQRFGGGVRLQRAGSLEEARALYEAEATRRGAPLPPPVHRIQ